MVAFLESKYKIKLLEIRAAIINRLYIF